MATLISFSIFTGFYLLYGTSRKMAGVGGLGIEKWIGGHPDISRYSGLALLIISMGLSCFYWGTGSGPFTFFIILMTVASLVILLVPLRMLSRKLVVLTFVCSLFCEIVLF